MKILVIDTLKEKHAEKVKYVFENNYSGYIEYIKIEKFETESLINILQEIYVSDARYDVIHLSIGIEIYNRDLERLCNCLFKCGTTIINAYSNEGGISYPAAFRSVIGVSAEKIPMYNSYITGSQVVNVLCNIQKVKVSNDSFEYGSSFSSVFVTINVIDELLNGENIIRKYNLSSNSLFDTTKLDILNNASNRGKVYVYPINKETKSLSENFKKNSMDILEFFDEKGFIPTNTLNGEFIGMCDYNADIFIIGHCDKSKIHAKRKREIISKCFERGILVYTFDEEGIDLNIEQKNLYSAPQISREHFKTYGKQFYISVPSISVFGTSSKQGKFTLLNKLNNKFKTEGIKVGCLSTEPQGLFCSADDIFANGYLGVNLRVEEEPSIINQKLMQLEYYGAELITLSTQSGILPRSIDNTGYFPFGINSVLFAYNSDINIIVCNYSDTIEYIYSCIKYIEATTRQSVQILVLSRVETHITDGVETQQLIKDYEKKLEKMNVNFEIECYDINDVEKISKKISNIFLQG